MASVVTGAGLMGNGNKSFTDLATAIRLAAWIMPPHRKDWAAAMLNEIAYVRSRRAAWHWVLGCALFAVRERTIYALANTWMSRRMLRSLFRLGAASFIAVIGLYMIQKPYQRERILITLFHHGASAAQHAKTVQSRIRG